MFNAVDSVDSSSIRVIQEVKAKVVVIGTDLSWNVDYSPLNLVQSSTVGQSVVARYYYIVSLNAKMN